MPNENKYIVLQADRDILKAGAAELAAKLRSEASQTRVALKQLKAADQARDSATLQLKQAQFALQRLQRQLAVAMEKQIALAAQKEVRQLLCGCQDFAVFFIEVIQCVSGTLTGNFKSAQPRNFYNALVNSL